VTLVSHRPVSVRGWFDPLLAKLFVHVARPFTVAKIAFLLATFCIHRIAATALVRFSKARLQNPTKRRRMFSPHGALNSALPGVIPFLELNPNCRALTFRSGQPLIRKGQTYNLRSRQTSRRSSKELL
jgi:hypothetical protein